MALDYSKEFASALMKIKYGKYQEKLFNKKFILYSRIKKVNTFEGKQRDEAMLLSLGGGVGCGPKLPKASDRKYKTTTVTAKKIHAVVEVDNESFAASQSSQGAFSSFTKQAIDLGVEALANNLERQIVRNGIDGDGALIKGDGSGDVATVSGGYTITFNKASTYFPASFEGLEEGHLVSVGSETTTLKVTDVDVTLLSTGYATAVVTLEGASETLKTRAAASGAAKKFKTTDALYMQGSKGNEVTGLTGVLTATSGSIYNVPVGRRTKATQVDASSAAISTALLNKAITQLLITSGDQPDLILVSAHQHSKIMDLLEDRKRYELPKRADKNADIGFKALHYEGPMGMIPILPSRYMDSDKVFLLNTEYITMHLRPGGFQWQDRDGAIWSRKAEEDAYQARRSGYGELYALPVKQGIIQNVAL